MTLELTTEEVLLLKIVVLDAVYERVLEDRKNGTKHWLKDIETLKGIKTKIDNEERIAYSQNYIKKIQRNTVYGKLIGEENGKQK